MNYHIAIIGPENLTSIFKAAGADIFTATTGVEAGEIAKRLKKQTDDPTNDKTKYAVVMILENLYRDIRADEREKLSIGTLPSVIAIPGFEGSTGESIKKLRRLAEQAVGSDILS